jgi:hypothetical protein
MQRTGMTEDNAREMIAIETGASDGDVIEDDRCPPDLVPFFVRGPDERDRWQTCWELSLKMLGGEDLGGWHPSSPANFTPAISRPADRSPLSRSASGMASGFGDNPIQYPED